MCKKSKLLIFLILILFSRIVSAQDSIHRKIDLVVKTDLFLSGVDLLTSRWTTYSITLEKLLFKHHSFQLTYLKAYINSPHDYPASIHTFQIIPEYKYFLFHKRNYSGLYAGVYMKYIQIDSKESFSYYMNQNLQTDNSEDIERIRAFGGLCGFQFYPWHGLTLDILFGMGRAATYSMTVKSGNYAPVSSAGRVDARAAINIGYRF